MRTLKIALKTGVTLNVAFAGEETNPPLVLLHGFPESHRTWRELVPRLSHHFFMVMPDQRGFGSSDRPRELEAYETAKLVDDVFALGDAVGLKELALIGHDWGGIIAWEAAMRGDPRIARLAIINAPHPVVYQRSLVESPEQRMAAQYVTQFRTAGFEQFVEQQGFGWFFDATLAPHIDQSKLSPDERERYIEDWSQPGAFPAMLNWYRAARFQVPAPGAPASVPDWAARPCEKIRVPTLVIWGMKDFALMPVQLEGLDEVAEDIRIVRLPNAGHFATWEAPDAVASALEAFLVRADQPLVVQ